MPLLPRVEAFLRESGVSATKLGREAVGDPRFVFELRSGREPGTAVQRRVSAYLDAHGDKAGGRPCAGE